MASLVPFLLYVLFSILLLSWLPIIAHGNDHREEFHSVNISTMFLSDTCSFTPQGKKNYSMRITHPYGPCSPQGTKVPIPTFQELILRDKARLEYIRQRRRIKAQTTSKRREDLETTLPASSSYYDYNFVITVGLGSPPVHQTVSVDTGSDLSWVNCKPCFGSCPNQTQPLFDPSFSTSYKSISCNDTVCLHAKNFTASNSQGVWWSCSGSDQSKCHYLQQYGDNSTVAGYLSQETLTLTTTTVVNNFVFGCDDNTTDPVADPTVAGLFGFGRGPLSLVSQIISSYDNVFSYCLPSSISSTGHLTFGPSALQNPTISYTPMPISVDDATFYFIDLLGISVSGQLLDIPTTVFTTNGTIIDSGTTLTYLTQTAYDIMTNAFSSGMTNYTQVQTEYGGLCYDVTGLAAIYVPSVALHLSNDVILDLVVDQIVYVFNTTNGLAMCLNFGPTPDGEIGILGYLQQKSYEVVYDLGRSQIGFGKGTCSV